MNVSPQEVISEEQIQAVLLEAASVLDPVCTAERRNKSKTLELLDNAIRSEQLMQDIQGNITESVAIREKTLSHEDRFTIVKGLVFENLALASLEKRECPYPHLETLLFTVLQDPNILIRTWYGEKYATTDGIKEARSKSQSDWFDENYNLKGSEQYDTLDPQQKRKMQLFFRELSDKNMWHALKNNDALSVTIERDKKGEPIAWVTGLREAKTYALNNSGNKEALAQAEKAPGNLKRVVKQLKGVFDIYRNLWEVTDELPERIDSKDKLDYEIVQPKDLEGVYVVSPIQGALAPVEKGAPIKDVRSIKYDYIDVTRAEIDAITKVLVAHFEWE